MSFQIQKGHFLKIFIVLCGIITVILLSKTLKRPDVYLNDTDQYNSTKAYLEISKNASKKGPLISGSNGKYEIYAIGPNDPAFPILISFLSFFGIEFSSLSDFQLINHILLWLSLICFLLIFRGKSLLIFSVVWLLIIFYLYRVGIEYSSRSADQHGTVPALTIFTFLLVEIFFGNKTKWQYGKLLILSVLGGLFGMFRNYFTHVFVLLVGLSSMNLLKSKTKNIWLRLIFPLFAILIILNLDGFLQKIFYYYSHVKNPDLSAMSPALEQTYSHGIWHSLYIGLGVFENKWGIEYKDEVGMEHARRYDPQAVYPNQEHYNAMKKLYLKYLKEEPFEYIINHIGKIFWVMGVVIKKSLVPIIVFLLILYRNFLKYRKRIIETVSMNPAHIVPLFIFFVVPVITTPSFVFSIITYTFMILIMLIARNLEIWQQQQKIYI